MRKVAVFFGGESCENEISVLTGVFVLNVLSTEKFDILPVFLAEDGGMFTSPKMKEIATFKKYTKSDFKRIIFEDGQAFVLSKGKLKSLGKIDVALNCCHGGWGEGGGLSAMMAWNGIAFASPDWTSSGVFMDKCATKLIARALNVPTVEYIRVNECDYQKRGAFLLKTIDARLKYPVVVKPAHLGSSIGISVAKNEEEAKTAIESAFMLDDRVIIERYLENKRDVNCAAYSLNGEIFVSEPELAFGEGVYSFEEKYIKRRMDGGKSAKGGGRYAFKGELREKIRAYTKTLYKRMDLQGVVRMDFLVADGKAYLCEVNTVPGSLAYYLFCERITDARDFFGALVEDAYRRGCAEKKARVRTGILQEVEWRRK